MSNVRIQKRGSDLMSLSVKKKINVLLRKANTFLTLKGCFDFLPDPLFLKMRYKVMLGRHLDLNNPVSFNEKLQWLKIHDRNPAYPSMVDKFEVKKYIADMLGEDFVIPTLGIWNSFDDIDFTTLPDKFVIKCTHDSGSVIICRNKDAFDKAKARKKIKRCMRRKLYRSTREWPYKSIMPRIIVEQYIESDSEKGLRDYKFYVFNGKVKYLYISEGLENHSTARISFLTPDWKQAPFARSDYRQFEVLPDKPKHLNDMILIAEKIAGDTPFRRIDLYEVRDQVLFSEITFFPCGGMMPFDSIEWDIKLGKEMKISI